MKSKGEKESYSHFYAEFQRITRRDKKAFLNALDKCSDLAHWEDAEGSGREGGGRGDRDGEYI